MSIRASLACTFAAALAACGPALLEDDTASLAQEIRGGTVDTADPAVVALAVRNQGYYENYCTGTLVGAKTVLTAAHCINAYGAGSFYYVLFGYNADSPSKIVHVASQVRDPKYRGDAYDFGIMQLDEVISGITPIELNTTAMTGSDVGRPIRHAGFGTIDGQSGSGVKRVVTFNVRQVTTNLIESGASGKQTCGGDSGGPAFMTFGGSTVEKLAGVVSFGDEQCLQDGWDGRVDVEAAWMKQTMSPWEVPTCIDDGKCLAGCAPVDPDCACVADGQCTADCARPSRDPDCPANCDSDSVCSSALCPRPDPDCIIEGSLCSNATQCRGRQCISDPQHPLTYCSLGCQADNDCPQGMACAGSICAMRQLPEVAPGETCTEESFCVAGRICNGPSGGITRCVAPCSVSSDCNLAGGEVCEGGRQSVRFCRVPGMSFEPPRIERAPEEYPALGCSSTGGVSLLAAVGLIALARRRIPRKLEER